LVKFNCLEEINNDDKDKKLEKMYYSLKGFFEEHVGKTDSCFSGQNYAGFSKFILGYNEEHTIYNDFIW
jgi:hypothetical protein